MSLSETTPRFFAVILEYKVKLSKKRMLLDNLVLRSLGLRAMILVFKDK